MSFPNYAPSTAVPPGAPASRPLSYATPSMDTIPLTPGSLQMLRQTRPWVAFIAGVLTVNCMLLLVLGAGGLAMASINGRHNALAPFAIWILVGVINMIPTGYLRKFAARLRELSDSENPDSLQAALEAQKNFWHAAGILTAVVVALYAIVLLAALAGSTRLFL